MAYRGLDASEQLVGSKSIQEDTVRFSIDTGMPLRLTAGESWAKLRDHGNRHRRADHCLPYLPVR